jgi:hypothetical protein
MSLAKVPDLRQHWLPINGRKGLVMENDMRSQSICKTYVTLNEHLGKYYTSEPTGKPPMKYWAVSVLVSGYSSDEDEYCDDFDDEHSCQPDVMYILRIMASGTPVLEITTIDYTHVNNDGEVDTHTKTRILKTMDDIWSAAPFGVQMDRLRRFMRKAGEIVNRDPTLFFPVVEEDPTPF